MRQPRIGREFRKRGATGSATASSRQRWFVAAQVVSTRVVNGQIEVVPRSVFHAKRMGTAMTACALPTWTWHKLWYLPFPLGAASTACQDCQRVVREDLAERGKDSFGP